MEEEEPVTHKIEPNKALSYSAPLYLYCTNPSSISEPTDEFSDLKFEPCPETETTLDSSTTLSTDELFHSGVLLPLKLPPRLQNFNKSSSGPTSPIMSSFFRSSFARTNLSKHRDFDPFTVALQKIRKDENCERRRELQPPRRSRSLSPLSNFNWVRKREKELQKSNAGCDMILQTKERIIGTGDSNIMIGKNMSRKGKQIVLRKIKPSNMNYKKSLFTCFGIGRNFGKIK
jgi:hypothetical protein